MVEFVAVDTTLADYGDKAFLIGVALEIDNGSEFDDHYKQVIDEFSNKHEFDLAFQVSDSEHLLRQIPGYEMREGTEQLAKKLLLNPAVRRVHITIGWFDEGEVFVGDTNESMSGIRFLNNHLQQYFPIVTLWDYYKQFQQSGDVPDEAWLDSVQGKTTNAWFHVGHKFEVNIVPHGDLTYPSLSTADFLAAHLRRTLPRNKNLEDLPDAAAGWTIGKIEEEDLTDDESPYVQANAINESNKDDIVPEYNHTIKGEQHYPHPIMFIYDDTFSQIDNDALPKTDFHSYARRWAQENSGSVVNFRADRLPNIVQDGDRIVFTTEEIPTVCKRLQRLNPTKDIGLQSSDGLIEMYLDGK